MDLKGKLKRIIIRVFTPIRVSFVLAMILHLLLLSSISGLFAFNDIPEEEIVSPAKLNFRVVQTPFEEKEAEISKDPPPVEQAVKSEMVEESKAISKKSIGVEGAEDNQKSSVDGVDREAEVKNIIQETENVPEDEPEKGIDQGKEDSLKDNIKNNIDIKDDNKEKSRDADSIEKKSDKQSVEVEKSANTIDKFPPGIGKPWDGSNNEIEVSRKEEQLEESRAIQKDEIKSIDSLKEKQESTLLTQETNNTEKEATEQVDVEIETANKDDSNRIEEGNKEENGHYETDRNEILDLTSGKTDEGIVLPELSTYKKPIYPENMRKRGIEGRVILEIIISHEGKVVKVEVKDSSGYEHFDKAAKDVVKGWLFKPAGRGRENLACRVLVPVEFRLN